MRRAAPVLAVLSALVVAVPLLALPARAAGGTTVGAGYLSGPGVQTAVTTFLVPTSCAGTGTAHLGLSGTDGLRIRDSERAEVEIVCRAGVPTASMVAHDPETGATDTVPVALGASVVAYLYLLPNVTVAMVTTSAGHGDLVEAIVAQAPLRHPTPRILVGSRGVAGRVPGLAPVTFAGTAFDEPLLSPTTGTRVEQVRRGVLVATASRVTPKDADFTVTRVGAAS